MLRPCGGVLWCLKLFYIKDRNQTTTVFSCFHAEKHYFTSKIEIKPQLRHIHYVRLINYFTSKIEIKPQLLIDFSIALPIILHQRSKSNHNKLSALINSRPLFYIKDRNQTTTVGSHSRQTDKLFYIKDRNQTTTKTYDVTSWAALFYIKDRKQTTTNGLIVNFGKVLFYIKDRNQTTTRKRNSSGEYWLFYIKDRNQTTTRRRHVREYIYYFTSKIEIKPQLISEA